MSDVHNPVELSLNFKLCKISNNEHNREHVVKLWDRTKSDDFITKLDMAKIQSIQDAIEDVTAERNFSQQNVDDIVKDIASLFLKTSSETFGYTNVKNNHTNNTINTYSWFGPRCNKARKNFHTAKYLYKLR